MKKYLGLAIVLYGFFLMAAPSAFAIVFPFENLPVTQEIIAAPKILSISENILSGKGISAKGTSALNVLITLSLRDEAGNLIYALKATPDSNGNWQAVFDQPLKKGNYYVEAIAEDSGGLTSFSSKSPMVHVRGAFALIIEIFSVLIIFFLIIFVSGWYLSKFTEEKRFRRILMSQRDLAASYNVMKKDVSRAQKLLFDQKVDSAEANEMEFILSRLDQNLEKMNKYVVGGVKTIGKYDVLSKLNKKLSFNKKEIN